MPVENLKELIKQLEYKERKETQAYHHLIFVL